MMRLITLVSTITLAGALACSSDETPAGPSASPDASVSSTASYTRRDLGTLGGTSSVANDINGVGVIVGSSSLASGVSHAFRWQNGVMTDLGTLGGRNSGAEAINPDGVIVGWSETAKGNRRAARWRNGTVRSLGTLGGLESAATDISPLGVIVGWSETARGEIHAFLWRDGVMKDLGTLGGPTSRAFAINLGGLVVGGSPTADGGDSHAFRYKNGVMEDLDRGRWGRSSSTALAINNAGVIVGVLGAFPDSEGEEREYTTPFRWYQGVLTDLKIPSGRAMDVNPDGIVTGSRPHGGGGVTPRDDAWVWQNGVTTWLPEPISASTSPLSGGHAINRRGDVVGYVQTGCDFDGCTGPRHATLWKRN
jgi:probable HAF family extracellular repeat protein